VKNKEHIGRGPRPMFAFLVSLGISSVLMGVLLFSDRRVLELRRARTEVTTLDRDIAAKKEENERLREAIEAAHRHEFPAEKVAREELHLVQPDDVVLLYPEGSLTKRHPAGAPQNLPIAAPAPATSRERTPAAAPERPK
jgi:cell division protein FtsB